MRDGSEDREELPVSRTEFFDRVAAGDDPLLFMPDDGPRIERLRRRLGEVAGMRVLEPGCGAGPLTEHLSAWVGNEGRVLAFDASRRMVERCRTRVAHLANVEVIRAEAETVDLGSGVWDMAILFRVFPHFDDKGAVLRLLRPCLAAGGRLVIANLEGSERLNALHAGSSEEVRQDRMPCAGEVSRLCVECGYAVSTAIDDDEEFYAEARPI